MQVNSFVSIAVFTFVILLILSGFRTSKNVERGKKRFLLDYGTAPLLGVLILIVTFSITQEVIVRGIIGSERIQPYSIIILFMSLAYVCISLDITGFFEYIALRVAKAAGSSARKLFVYFFFLSSVLTTFTSNDIVILTITPIVIYFAKYTKIDPVPYLIAQFFAANIWSITLYIGNPTNIIVAEAYDLTFIGYTMWTLLPTVASGLTCLALLLIVFRKKIPKSLEAPDIDPKSALRDKNGAIFGISCLIACLFMLSTAFLFNLLLWQICLFFAIVMLIRDLFHDIISRRYKKANNLESVKKIAIRMPWKIMPFVIGMFIMVEALAASGWVDLMATAISSASTEIITAVFLMTFLSSMVCNLMNNQPMTILFTEILISSSFVASESIKFGVMFALIMGSNFGANFTLIGALAGIMWHKIASDKEVSISFKNFAKYGFTIMPIVVLIACLLLSLELIFWL